MVEQQDVLVSHKEIDFLRRSLPSGAFHIALGYLIQLRQPIEDDASLSLQKIHQEAVSTLIPGDDHDAYVSMHRRF